MKKLLLLLILTASPAFANPNKPFTYETNCILEHDNKTYEDVCKVIETRETTGALKTRNIFSNRFRLTIKGRFDKEKGCMTWDSYNKFEYPWQYKIAGTGWTYVMPGVLIENISWD